MYVIEFMISNGHLNLSGVWGVCESMNKHQKDMC